MCGLLTVNDTLNKNYYSVLGVDSTASSKDIKKAFRALAVKYHPDKNPKGIDKFREISEAYEVLKDPSKKEAYDQKLTHKNIFRHGSFSFTFNNPFPFGFRPPHLVHNNISVIYNVPLSSTMQDTFNDVKYRWKRICPSCTEKGGSISYCKTCFGTLKRCPVCNGIGFVLEVPNDVDCSLCKSKRILEEYRTLKFKLPKGVKNDDKLLFNSLGHDFNPFFQPGNLEIKIRIENHPYFAISGIDLVTTQHISFSQAALGTTLLIDILGHKTLKVKIRPGIQSNTFLRIPGEGSFVPNTEKRGDVLIKIIVDTPSVISDEEIKIFNKLNKIGVESET